jgi:cephalosporin hydroxylase
MYLETTPDAHEDYKAEKRMRIEAYRNDKAFQTLSNEWRTMALDKHYMHNFSWLGRPLIQLPMDMMAMQEIIWAVKPDLIIETGIAHGGSLIFNASMLTLLEACGEIENGKVLGIDIDIRPHNKEAINTHPLSSKITMIEGSSIDPSIINQVHRFAEKGKKILVCLDSHHTHEHVLAELEAYAPLVSAHSYCIVLDTFIEDMPESYIWKERPWGKGDNPKTAIFQWLKNHPEFETNDSMEHKLLITSAPSGFLYRAK